MAGNIGDMRTDVEALAQARERAWALHARLEASEEGPVRLVETHISWVLLAGSLVYKLKKPVRLPFLDFTTLDSRRHCCDEELRLNRRLAPSLYLDVVDVCDGPDGPSFGGAGDVVDVAVRMHRFPEGALWSEMLAAGTLASCHVDAMARRLSDFHQDAAVASPDGVFGSAASHQRTTRRLVETIDSSRAELEWPAMSIDWPALQAWLNGQQLALAPLWAARLRDGHVRECHGDLHLANVLQLDGAATAFDGIEFDDELRWIDVLDDIAFLAMDLLAHGRRALAFRFVNTYLEASGEYDGLPALRFYMVSRALVRAQVIAIGERQGLRSLSSCDAARYLTLAAELSRSADARLAITHGLPGSGKSFASQSLAETVGAIRVRSDVERKRLFGLRALESSSDRVPGGIYDDITTKRTYSRLRAVAHVALRAGWPVIVDAAFMRRSERAQFATLAASLAVPFSIVDCRAEWPLLRQRLERRQANGRDASEADVAVLERLRSLDEPLDERERAVAITVDSPSVCAALDGVLDLRQAPSHRVSASSGVELVGWRRSQREGNVDMSLFHAVVWTDHQTAQVLQFDTEHVLAHKVRTHTHHTAQHGSAVRTQHEFFGDVCDALDGVAQVLVTGSHTAIADFRHYADKHRPQTATRIVGYEVVDHPSENQLVALARKYFLAHDRMAGTSTPS